MKTLRNIFFQVDAHQMYPLVRIPDVLLSLLGIGHIIEWHFALATERRIILRNLIILRHVRIEIMLAIEFTDWRYARLKNQTRQGSQFERLQVHHRQSARQYQTDRTDMPIGVRAVFDGTTTKHLAPRLQLAPNSSKELACVARKS